MGRGNASVMSNRVASAITILAISFASAALPANALAEKGQRQVPPPQHVLAKQAQNGIALSESELKNILSFSAIIVPHHNTPQFPSLQIIDDNKVYLGLQGPLVQKTNYYFEGDKLCLAENDILNGCLSFYRVGSKLLIMKVVRGSYVQLVAMRMQGG